MNFIAKDQSFDSNNSNIKPNIYENESDSDALDSKTSYKTSPPNSEEISKVYCEDIFFFKSDVDKNQL